MSYVGWGVPWLIFWLGSNARFFRSCKEHCFITVAAKNTKSSSDCSGDVYYNPLSWRFLLMVCIEPCCLALLGAAGTLKHPIGQSMPTCLRLDALYGNDPHWADGPGVKQQMKRQTGGFWGFWGCLKLKGNRRILWWKPLDFLGRRSIKYEMHPFWHLVREPDAVFFCLVIHEAFHGWSQSGVACQWYLYSFVRRPPTKWHGWNCQVTTMILIQPLFIVFMGVVPSLCLKYGYTTMMTVSLVYLYSVIISELPWTENNRHAEIAMLEINFAQHLHRKLNVGTTFFIHRLRETKYSNSHPQTDEPKKNSGPLHSEPVHSGDWYAASLDAGSLHPGRWRLGFRPSWGFRGCVLEQRGGKWWTLRREKPIWNVSYCFESLFIVSCGRQI